MRRSVAIGLVSVLGLFALLGPAQAAERTDWFHQARWGVLLHYLGAPPSSAGGAELTAEKWNEQIDAFDTAALAEQLASTGAKYCVFTIGQNSGHYCSPNATYDKIVGIRPSKCSRRDLIADLAVALAPHGIRLMVYLPSGAPAADPVARKKLQWRWGQPGGWQLPGEPTGGRLVEFQRSWEAVVREWSARWGHNVHGWWIDGCYFADEMYRHADEPNFATLAAALKAGNPDSLVAFNPGVKVPVVCHSEHEDYTAGEVTLEKVPDALQSCPGRWIERGGKRVQYQLLSYLGTSWCQGERPVLSDDVIIGYTRQLNQQGGVITWDVPISTTGEVPQPFVDQLTALGAALRFEADAIATSKGDLEITFIGHGTLMFRFDGKVIHVDPVSRYADYSRLPKADVILVTHEHGDHFDTETIETISTKDTAIVLTETCASRITGGVVLTNGDVKNIKGLAIEAVPAYNVVHMRGPGQPFHPKGAGNGYVITFGDKRIYVAGDTENIPEMARLAGVDCAFLPMNVPYTMTPEMVADA
ncbi:MAG: MBL fold metallo-hydrolase, partial [Planctomycetota bacterium]